MPHTEVHPSLWHRDAARCGHLRQRHPLHDEALLVCAWPGCPEGTVSVIIQVPVTDDRAGKNVVLVRFERESVSRGDRLAFRWRSSS